MSFNYISEFVNRDNQHYEIRKRWSFSCAGLASYILLSKEGSKIEKRSRSVSEITIRNYRCYASQIWADDENEEYINGAIYAQAQCKFTLHSICNYMFGELLKTKDAKLKSANYYGFLEYPHLEDRIRIL